jgi:single-strand DNA-binding protein
MSINSVSISGNLGRDPELRVTPTGTSVLSLSVAVNDRVRDQQTGEWRDRANWVDVVVFGSRADAIAPRLAKGSKVVVSGRLRWSQWQDKQTGTNRSKLEVIADEVVFLTPQQQPTNQAPQQAPQGRAYAPQATQAAPRPQAAPAYAPPAQGVYDESIPF